MIILRSILVWLLIIVVEIIHGILRGQYLQPLVGDWRARQLGVAIGSVLIFLVSFLCVEWMQATTTTQLLAIGCLWTGLTVAFEVLFGRYVAHLSWERLRSDYALLQGGLMPIGLALMALSPWLANIVHP